MELVRKDLDTKYRVFRLTRTGVIGRDADLCLLPSNHEIFDSEAEADEWIRNSGDYRAANYDYVVLPCRKVIAHYE